MERTEEFMNLATHDSTGMTPYSGKDPYESLKKLSISTDSQNQRERCLWKIELKEK